MSETRTVQEIARAQATATMIEPEHSIMLAMSNRIDTLEKALTMAHAIIMEAAEPGQYTEQEKAIRAALHPSENDAQVAGPMK